MPSKLFCGKPTEESPYDNANGEITHDIDAHYKQFEGQHVISADSSSSPRTTMHMEKMNG